MFVNYGEIGREGEGGGGGKRAPPARARTLILWRRGGPADRAAFRQGRREAKIAIEAAGSGQVRNGFNGRTVCVCVRVRVRVCVRACVSACLRACVRACRVSRQDRVRNRPQTDLSRAGPAGSANARAAGSGTASHANGGGRRRRVILRVLRRHSAAPPAPTPAASGVGRPPPPPSGEMGDDLNWRRFELATIRIGDDSNWQRFELATIRIEDDSNWAASPAHGAAAPIWVA